MTRKFRKDRLDTVIIYICILYGILAQLYAISQAKSGEQFFFMTVGAWTPLALYQFGKYIFNYVFPKRKNDKKK